MCQNARDSFNDASKRWGCEWIELFDNKFPLHFPSWNKFSIFNKTEFERILFLDSDMLISNHAPNPFNYQGQFITVKDVHEKYLNYKDELMNIIKDYLYPHYLYLRNKDLTLDENYIKNFFNSGFMLFYPKLTSDLIHKYNSLILNDENRGSHREQSIINYIVQKELSITYLDRKWNVIDPDTNNPMNGYIYHFTGTNNSFLKKQILQYKWN